MKLPKNPGRTIGLVYLVVLIFGVFTLMYVPGRLIVRDNMLETLGNIAASETLFRLGIGAELISQSLFIVVALGLYELFKGVNQPRGVLMATLAIAPIPIAFINELNAIATLVLLHGEDFLASIQKPERDALAMLFIKMHGYGLDISSVFWGLWLFPLGLLVYRSGIVPRILGILLIANCFSYVANSLASLVAPQYEHIVSRLTTPLQFGELLFLVWLLVVGAVPKATAEST
jgi:hypothetical protein